MAQALEQLSVSVRAHTRGCIDPADVCGLVRGKQFLIINLAESIANTVVVREIERRREIAGAI